MTVAGTVMKMCPRSHHACAERERRCRGAEGPPGRGRLVHRAVRSGDSFIILDSKWFERDEPRSKAWTAVLTLVWVVYLVGVGYLVEKVGYDIATS